MGIAGLIVAVDDHGLGAGAPDDGHQATGRLVERRGGEAVRVGVGLGTGHARVAVPEHHDLVVADHLGGPGQFQASDPGQIGPDLGRVQGGIEDLPLGPVRAADEDGAHPLGVVAGDRARPLGGLVIGVGVDGEQATILRHADHATGMPAPTLQLSVRKEHHQWVS